MRKNINKVIAFAIGISVMSGSITPVFAADNTQNINATTNVQNQSNQKSVLTLDDAIKAAISSSETLELDTKQITYQNTSNDINEDLDEFNNDYNYIDDDKQDFNEDTRDITINKLRQQRDFDQDVLIQKVTTAYNDLVTSQMEINKAAKELEIKNKELSNAKLKESLGIKTSTDLKSAELEIESLQNAQKSRENALKDAQYSFKALTGKDVTEFTLEQDIKYEPFKVEGSEDKYLDGVIDKYLKYSEQLIKLNKDYYYDSDRKITANDVDDAKTVTEEAIEAGEPKLSNYTSGVYSTDYDNYKADYDNYKADYDKYEKDISAYTSAVSKRLTYLQSKLSVDENQTSLNESKKQFKNQLRTYYTNLLTAEDNINYIKKNIELNNKKLSDAKLKYDLGMITESDYNSQVVSSEDLDLQLRSAIDSYNIIKEKIQKPWIAFSS